MGNLCRIGWLRKAVERWGRWQRVSGEGAFSCLPDLATHSMQRYAVMAFFLFLLGLFPSFPLVLSPRPYISFFYLSLIDHKRTEDSAPRRSGFRKQRSECPVRAVSTERYGCVRFRTRREAGTVDSKLTKLVYADLIPFPCIISMSMSGWPVPRDLFLFRHSGGFCFSSSLFCIFLF